MGGDWGRALHLSLEGNSGPLTWARLQQLQEQRYPFLTVCAEFSCVQTKVSLPMLGIFNVHTDVTVCHCTRGPYRHSKRVSTESWLLEKNPLPPQRIEPTSTACPLNTIPTELHPLAKNFYCSWLVSFQEQCWGQVQLTRKIHFGNFAPLRKQEKLEFLEDVTRHPKGCWRSALLRMPS